MGTVMGMKNATNNAASDCNAVHAAASRTLKSYMRAVRAALRGPAFGPEHDRNVARVERARAAMKRASQAAASYRAAVIARCAA